MAASEILGFAMYRTSVIANVCNVKGTAPKGTVIIALTEISATKTAVITIFLV